MPFLSLARVIDRGFQILDYRQKMYFTSELGIENQAHWTLDVTLAEDASRILSIVLGMQALLRRIALGLPYLAH